MGWAGADFWWDRGGGARVAEAQWPLRRLRRAGPGAIERASRYSLRDGSFRGCLILDGAALFLVSVYFWEQLAGGKFQAWSQSSAFPQPWFLG
jgi:hypothetical protein